ncbi:MAG: TraB/GumN family protein [Pseudomonadota bacterium]
MAAFKRILLAVLLASLAACGGKGEEGQAGAEHGADAHADEEASKPKPKRIGGEDRPQTVAEAVEGPSRVALWLVEDEDTKVYILGTIHLMNARVDWTTPQIDRAFAEADAVYLEADFFSQNAQRAMGVVVTQNAEYPDSGRMSSDLEKEEKEAVKYALKEIHVDFSDFDGYRPWFATIQTMSYAVVESGGDPTYAADVVIASDMAARGKPLRYLETALHHINIRAAAPDELYKPYYFELVKDLKYGEVYFADLMGAWYNGDMTRLNHVINGVMDHHPELKEMVLTRSNVEWSRQLDRLLTDEPGTFVVAISADHVVGESSVQNQLGRRGYEVERMIPTEG